MTDNFKKFLTGTFLCVATFSSLTLADSAIAVQDVEPSQSTLQALLASSPKRTALSPLTQVQQVTYTETDQADAPANALQPLLPQLPKPPKFRPTPLLPSIAQQETSPLVSAVPVSQNTPSSVPVVSQVAPSQATSPQSIIVPVVSGSNAPQPVINAPLPQQSPNAGSFAYPAVPVRPTATVPVVNGQAISAQNISAQQTASQNFAAPAIQSKPMIPTIPTVEADSADLLEKTVKETARPTAPVSQQPLVQSAPEVGVQEVDVQSPVVNAPLVEEATAAAKKTIVEARSATQSFAQSVQSRVNEAKSRIQQSAKSKSEAIANSSQSLEQAVVEAQAEIAGNEIQVEEVSTDQLMNMIMGPGKIKASTVSAIKPMNTEQRVATIGSGTDLTEDTVMQVSSPQQVFSDAAPSYLNAPCDTGYGCDAERPNMPSCLPYDGCGCVSGAMGYAFVDFLYMDRDKGDFSASLLPANDAYDYSPGARFRFGRKYDSIEGWEIGFTALDAHTANTQILSPTNSLSPRLFPTDGFTLASISSFNGASFHESFQKSHFYSAEMNRMSWNWDVMSSFIGLRYTSIDDMYGLNTIGAGGDFGTYRLRARNHLIGPQIGGELFYDIGRRLSFSVTGKLGGYLNFYQTNTEFANNNLMIIDNTDEDVDLSWSTELGVFARYMLTPRAKLKVGYEFWYFDNVASAQGQYNGFITPFSGLNSSNSDDALYHGASFGLEWYR